jgi:Uma2 family endonuclease
MKPEIYFFLAFRKNFLQSVIMENLARKLLSSDEYFQMEENSEIKHEFYRGDVFAMAGAKRKHNIVVSNLIITIGSSFKNRPCVVYPSDMRVRVEEGRHYTYPDLSLVCGRSEFSDSKQTTLINPQVIIEVLSDSTENYDRGKKFQAYRTIPSLQSYILVGSESPLIELFSKLPNNTWVLSDAIENRIFIPSLDLTLSLSDVYDKINWEEENGETESTD